MTARAATAKMHQKRREAIAFVLAVLAGALVVVVAAVGMHLHNHDSAHRRVGDLEKAPGMNPGELARTSQLTDLDGKPVPLFGQESEFTVLCFTSRKCPGCSDEAPVWRRLQEVGPTRSTRMFLVSADSGVKEIRRYLEAYDLAGVPAVYDPAGKVLESFKIQLMPQYLLFDRKGRLVHRDIGYSKARGITPEERVRTILAAAEKAARG